MRLGDVLERLETAINNRDFSDKKRYAVVWLKETIRCIPVKKVANNTEVFGFVTEKDCTDGLRGEHWDRLIAHILIYLKRSGKCQL